MRIPTFTNRKRGFKWELYVGPNITVFWGTFQIRGILYKQSLTRAKNNSFFFVKHNYIHEGYIKDHISHSNAFNSPSYRKDYLLIANL